MPDISARTEFKALSPEEQSSQNLYDFNADFISATIDTPVAAAYVRVRLVAKHVDSNGLASDVTDILEIYPHTSTNEGKTLNYKVSQIDNKDNVISSYTKTTPIDPYNFFRQLTVQKVAQGGGNTITLVLFDPSGSLIEDQFIYNFFNNNVKIGGKEINRGVRIIIEYGWDHGWDSETGVITKSFKYNNLDGTSRTINYHPRLIGTSHSYILTDINIGAEFWGVTYTLQFVDETSNTLNTKPNEVTQKPLIEKALENKKEKWNVFQAILAVWRSMYITHCTKSDTELTLLLRSSNDTTGSLAPKYWDGVGDKWTKKFPGDWQVTDTPFLKWISDLLQTEIDDDNYTYTYTLYPSGQPIPGKSSDYEVYVPNPGQTTSADQMKAEWGPVSSVSTSEGSGLFANTQNFSNNEWALPSGYGALVITKNKLAKIAQGDVNSNNIADMQKDLVIAKKYKWLTVERSPYNTVINVNLGSNSFFALFGSRLIPGEIADQNADVSEILKKLNINQTIDKSSSTFDVSALCGMGGMGVPSKPSRSVTIDKSDKQKYLYDAAVALKIVEATMSFIGLTVTLQVIGDPDLERVLYHKGVQIDWDSTGSAMVNWLRGTYFVESLRDNIDNGWFQSEISLIKVGGLSMEDVKKQDDLETGLSNTVYQTQSSTSPKASVPAVSPLGGKIKVKQGTNSDSIINNGTGDNSSNTNQNINKISDSKLNGAINKVTSLNKNIDTIDADQLKSFFYALKSSSNTTILNSLFGPASISLVSLFSNKNNFEESLTSQSINLQSGVSYFFEAYNDYNFRHLNDNERTLAATLSYKYGLMAMKRVKDTLKNDNKEVTVASIKTGIREEISKAEYAVFGTLKERLTNLDNFLNVINE